MIEDPRLQDALGPEFTLKGPITVDQVCEVSRMMHPEMRGYVVPDQGEGNDAFYSGLMDAIPISPGISVVLSAVRTEMDGGSSAILPESSSVLMLLKGKAVTAQVSGCDDVTLRPFHALMIKVSGKARLAGKVEAGQEFHKVVVQWDPRQIADPRLKKAAMSLTEETHVRQIALPPETWRRARALLEKTPDPLLRKLKAESFAFEVIAFALSNESTDVDGVGQGLSVQDRTGLYRARDSILTAPFERHNVASLARESGMSVTAFKRKFPQLFGQSPIAFLRDTRLDRACLGLEGEGWSVSYAAEQAGYGHMSNFSTAFRRRFGLSPGAVGKV